MHSQASHVRERSRIVFRIAGLCAALATALLIAAVAGAQDPQAREGTEPQAQATASEKSLLPQIMFTSIKGANSDIYRMDPEGTTEAVQLTEAGVNAAGLPFGNAFAAAPPDGKRIVFDSNRDRTETEPLNTSDLYVINTDTDATTTDGPEETPVIRGSSATWAPDSKHIAYHASASGGKICEREPPPTQKCPLIFEAPGNATVDSDIFALNVYDRIENEAQPIKLTDTGEATIDDDADWSPTDGQTIILTSFPGTELPRSTDTPVPHKEIYAKKADGTDANDPSKWINLTQTNDAPNNKEGTLFGLEERAPAWSPDGERIVFSCRRPTAANNYSQRFKICIRDVDRDESSGNITGTSHEVQLINEETLSSQPQPALSPPPALTPTWTPDGQHIVFHRNTTFPTRGGERLFVMDAKDEEGAPDGGPDGKGDHLEELTQPPGPNLFVKGGMLRVKDEGLDE